MKSFNLNLLLLSIISFTSCGSKKNTVNFKLESNKASYQLGETLSIEPKTLTDAKIDKITYSFQNKEFTPENNVFTEVLDNELLGKHTVYATITHGDETENVTTEVTILNNKAPKIYNYEIVNTYPHNDSYYTQGLEFKGDDLYESAGKNGESKLAKVDLETGKVLKEHALSDSYFAEGLTIIGNKIHQLTWKANIGFTYNIETFEQESTFAYNQSKEGWGLCHDDQYIYKSDGSTKIWKLNKDTLAEESYIQITTNKGLKSKFNELEWVNGKIYANTWQKDGIAIINPNNGAIEAIINLKGIRKKVGVHESDSNRVLNGIAYKKETDQLYVTGKYWSKLFEIKVIE